MFTFHDETQAARVEQFTESLTNLRIPPRMAQEFSFGMGYPVFNFYAPTAYWISSFLVLSGFSVIAALKTSFLFALLGAFVGMYLLVREILEDEHSALLGATLYVTSLFIPVEIFVRGNLAEMWFISLFPITLFLLIKNSTSLTKKTFFLSTLFLSLLFTTHNILSLLSLIIIAVIMSVLPNKKRNLFSYFLAILLSSYFLIPALMESHLTYASEIAKMTNYSDHFLCIRQLWSPPTGGWGFGGSVPGCVSDGMSFALGKPQLLFGMLGIILLGYRIIRKKIDKYRLLIIAISMGTVVSLLLTTYQSKPIWSVLSPLFSLFQFPWRFLVFGIVGLSIMGAYALRVLHTPRLALYAISLGLIILVTPYFSGQSLSNTLYESKYLSNDYIRNAVAYKIPEYLPKTADYKKWRSFEGKNEVPLGEVNMHYFPYLKIEVDGREIVPDTFDSLGRPQLHLKPGSKLIVSYRQTQIEKLGNSVSMIGIVLLGMILFYKPLWTKIQKIKN